MSSRKTFEGPYFKALDDEQGTFEAVVSVFGNVDYQGDRVLKGAFEENIKEWQAKAKPLPVVWSHDWGNPFAHIGYVDPMDMAEISTETAKSKGFGDITGGLYVKGRLDVHKEFARQVYDLLKEGRVNEWSFAYDVMDEERAKDGANELKALKVWEVGPTLKGANNMTTTIAVKSALDTAHRVDIAAPALREAFEFNHDVGMKMLSDFVETTKAHIDGLKWDGDAAMRKCKGAGDFRSISFEKDNDSDPDTAAHWCLPHHATPHGPADEGGVSAALGRLNQTGPTVMSKDAIRSHLERHQGGKAYDEEDVETKSLGTVDGSMEERMNMIMDALFASDFYGMPVATFEDRVIVCSRDPEGDMIYSSIPYEIDGERVTLGDSTPVDISTTVSAKALEQFKAQMKPWHISKRDGKYCVIKDTDGSTEKCHDTREEAVAHMRALYANEPKSDVTPSFSSTVANYNVPAPITTTVPNGTITVTSSFTNAEGDKAGRRISKDSEAAIRSAIAALTALLTEDPESDASANTEKSADEAAAPEADGAKGVESAEVDPTIAHFKAMIEALKMGE